MKHGCLAFVVKSERGKKAQLRERIAQYGHEIEGFKAQEVAYTRGLAVLEKEIATLRPLFDKGLVNMQRLNSLEAEATTFEAERGEKNRISSADCWENHRNEVADSLDRSRAQNRGRK
ncbi:hypothetical protein [uncultured Cohaesibacter sp.]|uniref:hypothetical protein n=1 Tax=uncultured Cohaesibacter sp. TaxID=1002546 RepID=UPI0037489329